jgi:hypothetical protein
MIAQQICRISITTFHPSSIFHDAGFGTVEALLASWGFGLVTLFLAGPASGQSTHSDAARFCGSHLHR